MMLSILIPTFNYDCTPLVKGLSAMARTAGLDHEIIVGDDASTDPAVGRACDRLAERDGVKCLRPSHNMGRAALRNRLAREARGEWLLFLDSDGMPPDGLFLARYVQALAGRADVVCGGIVHPDHQPSADVSLRYRYEKDAEKHNTAKRRNRRPYASFRSFNFAIRRTVFLGIGFDESFRRYGYEDVLFGIRLAEADAVVLHVDNPLLNCDLESNAAFLRKTEEALCTLAEHEDLIGRHVKVCACLHRLPLWLRRGFLKPLFGVCAPALRRQLTGKTPSVFAFNLYKLLYLNRQTASSPAG